MKESDKPSVYIIFDPEHDKDLCDAFVEAAKSKRSRFSVAGHSTDEFRFGNWSESFCERIKGAEQVVVLCGENTHLSEAVSRELAEVKKRKTPYLLLRGQSGRPWKKPKSAEVNDDVHDWSPDTLRRLLGIKARG